MDRLTAETRQRLGDIENESQAKIQAAIEQGNTERQQIIAQARQESEDEIARARAEINVKKMRLSLNCVVLLLNSRLMQPAKSSVRS